MKIYLKALFILAILVLSSVESFDLKISQSQVMEDFDPLVDIIITVEFLSIRSLDEIDGSEPDFFLRVFIDGKEYTSPVWENESYLYNCWEVSQNVADDKEIVNITICLMDKNPDGDLLCDISRDGNEGNQGYEVTLYYNIKTGRWDGGDFIGDSSGYGRLNGCDDGSIYENERDCEIYFNVHQNDYDGDGIPYWMEVHEYGTDPLVDDRGKDYDGDGIPTEWEYRWGFDPLKWEDHEHLDTDNDSITDFEEYLTQSFLSDPFRKDLFLEVDCMEGENGHIVSANAVEMLKNPFHRRNIVFHVEIGEMIPFDSSTSQQEVLEIYRNYFLHNNESNWKRSIFHYGVFVNDCFPTGYSFAGDGPAFWGYGPGTNSFVVSITQMKKYDRFRPDIPFDYFIASVIMHEVGHHFGIRFGNPPGCDNQFSKYPWQMGYYMYRNYKSIMNYRYTYHILDYSDGSHGKRDFNDWEYINQNFSYFELPTDW